MKKSNVILLIAIVLGFLAIVFINNIRGEKGLVRTEFSGKNILPDNNSSKGLKDVIDNSLKDSQGTYGIVVKNLKTGEYYYLNENKVFDPGSLYKLWVMAVTFQQLEKGTITDSEVLSQYIQELNNQFGIPSDAAELTDGAITLTVKDALEQMITISHNYAALLLIEKIGRPSIQDFLKNYGFSASKTGDAVETTPKEIAVFLEKLYKGEFANPENTAKMIDLLKRQTKNEKLPKYLPVGTEIAHKTGEIDYFSHDAGTIYTPKGDYIIVVLSESDSPPGAEERIAEISKNVFRYFESD